jgi:regulator of replication initiation timing
MISIEEINLWLMSNRMCVMPIAAYEAYNTKLTEAQAKLHTLESEVAVRKSVRVGKLVEENKLLKKNLKRLRQTLGRLRTGEVKRCLSLLARQRNSNSNTQAQTS